MWFRMRTGAQSTSIHFKPPLEVDCAEVDSIHFECALAPMRIGCEISQCALNAHSMRIGFQCEKAFRHWLRINMRKKFIEKCYSVILLRCVNLDIVVMQLPYAGPWLFQLEIITMINMELVTKFSNISVHSFEYFFRI